MLRTAYEEFMERFIKDIATTLDKNIREFGADREDILKWVEEVCERNNI